MEAKDLGHTKQCGYCRGQGTSEVYTGSVFADVVCHVCGGSGRLPDLYIPPWYSHIYLAEYEVDLSRISIWDWMRLPDSGEPGWFNRLKESAIPNPHRSLEKVNNLDLVKVGWSKRDDPRLRIDELTRTRYANTVWCLGVPVRPTGRVVFKVGTEEVEGMLHRRWGQQCHTCITGSCKIRNHSWIEGEFFTRNQEMIELGLLLSPE